MRRIQLLSLLLLLMGCANTSLAFGQSVAELKQLGQTLEYIAKQSKAWHSKKKSHSDEAYFQQMAQVDARHRQQIDSIFARYGWLTPPQVSKKASRAYFEVIQLAPISYQEKYLNEVFKATQARIVQPSEYYLLVDYVRTQQNKYQIFGTQGKTDDLGNFYFVPIDTTLVHNRKLPILPPGEYIYFSNPQWTTLFFHLSDAQANPVGQVQLYWGDELIGETNAQGFAQILVPRFRGKKTLHYRKGKGSQTVEISNAQGKDWLDIFSTFTSAN